MSNNYKALLKRVYGSKKVNIHPQTLASLVLLSHFDNNTKSNDIETVIGGENGIWSRIQTLEKEMASAKHFRGAFWSWDEIKNIPNPVPGDYAIWKRKEEEDIFAIWDVAANDNIGAWREVGHVWQSAVTSVNGDVGDVILTGDNIDSSYDSSGNTKKISEIFKALTTLVNSHSDAIDDLVENDENLQKQIDELEVLIGVANANNLKFKGEWNNVEVYAKNDVVKLNKYLYVAINNDVTSNPSGYQENGDWDILTEGFSGNYSDLIGVPEDLINQTQLENAIKEAVGDIDVSEQINAHNLDENSHPYIKQLIENTKNELMGLLPTVTILEE
jgi:hypothetical protein